MDIARPVAVSCSYRYYRFDVGDQLLMSRHCQRSDDVAGSTDAVLVEFYSVLQHQELVPPIMVHTDDDRL